jgi:hypothetical protein
MDNSTVKCKRGRKSSFSNNRGSFDNNRGSFDNTYDDDDNNNNNRNSLSERTNSFGNSNMMMKRSKTVHNFSHIINDNDSDSLSPTTSKSSLTLSKSKSFGMIISNNNINENKGSYYNEFCNQKTSFDFFFNEKSKKTHEIDKTSSIFESLFSEFN